jgi:hypothetical protein
LKNVLVIKLLLFVILSVCFVNCSRQKEVNGIVVSELLLIVSKEQNINYCKLLNEAIKGNVSSINKLALLEFYDGVAYDHSAVIVDLINLIGEDKFIQSIKTTSKEQKQIVIGCIFRTKSTTNSAQTLPPIPHQTLPLF